MMPRNYTPTPNQMSRSAILQVKCYSASGVVLLECYSASGVVLLECYSAGGVIDTYVCNTSLA